MMGVCQSISNDSEYREQYKVSKQIDKSLEKKTNRLERKILLLGPGESGKSTVLKQMRMMHHIGYSSHEMTEKKYLVFLNIIQGMQKCIDYVEKSTFDQLPDNLVEARNIVLQHAKKHEYSNSLLEPDLVQALKLLWPSEYIRKAYANRNQFHLSDSTEYFFENLDRIAKPDYEPTTVDILYTRVATTGVVKVEFELKKILFTVIDVGGQRSERKKWIHCFDDVNAVLFVAAISEYDQRIVEDDATNRIDESLKLFYEICNSRYFKEASMIVFLNKIDLFKIKIEKVNIRDYFKDFQDENTYQNGINYFRQKFERCILLKSKKPYFHETCAVSDTVQYVLNSVIDTIIQENLKDTGMM